MEQREDRPDPEHSGASRPTPDARPSIVAMEAELLHVRQAPDDPTTAAWPSMTSSDGGGESGPRDIIGRGPRPRGNDHLPPVQHHRMPLQYARFRPAPSRCRPPGSRTGQFTGDPGRFVSTLEPCSSTDRNDARTLHSDESNDAPRHWPTHHPTNRARDEHDMVTIIGPLPCSDFTLCQLPQRRSVGQLLDVDRGHPSYSSMRRTIRSSSVNASTGSSTLLWLSRRAQPPVCDRTMMQQASASIAADQTPCAERLAADA